MPSAPDPANRLHDHQSTPVYAGGDTRSAGWDALLAGIRGGLTLRKTAPPQSGGATWYRAAFNNAKAHDAAVLKPAAGPSSVSRRQTSPAKALDDLSSGDNMMDLLTQALQWQGKRYADAQHVGNGLWGVAARLTSDSRNNSVLIKSLLPEYAHAYRHVIEEEVISHSRVMGEDRLGHPNIIGFKGVAVGQDHSVHVVMEEAKGGNLQNFAQALCHLSRAGVVPPAVRHAVMKDMCNEAAAGLHAVHEAGLLHIDVKALNYLLTENGTVKISDFGSAKLIDPDQNITLLDHDEVRVTRELTPPEKKTLSSGDIENKKPVPMSTAFDVHLFAQMVQGLMSDTMIEGELIKSGGYLPNLADGPAISAMDRMLHAALRENPGDRSSLEGMMQSALLNDSIPLPEQDMTRLKTAIVDYTRLLGQKNIDRLERVNQQIARSTALQNVDRELMRAVPRVISPWCKTAATPAETRVILQSVRDTLAGDIASHDAQWAKDAGKLHAIECNPQTQSVLQEIHDIATILLPATQP